jgi:hypothetical protein
MAEHHQPVAMSHAELWALLARYQRSLHQLLELAGPDDAERGVTAAPSAPLETERQAQELPAVRAVYEAFRASPGVGRMAPRNHRMLEEACSAAGVEPGAFDHRILLWLAGFEPTTCAVVAGLIGRAAAGGAR